ncbi:unnamed protein product [Oreochromis niloticus]|nr:unnamed protein product [Mustela putorius furo]
MTCCSESNMVLELSLRAPLICLLIGTGCTFPAPDYRYPYPGGGPSSGLSNLQSEAFHYPLVSLMYEDAPERGGSPPGSQSPSGPVASLPARRSVPIYEPKKFVVTYDSSSDESSPPEVQSPGPWFSSLGAVRKPPSVSVNPRSALRTSERPHVVFGSRPVYEALLPPRGVRYAGGNSASYRSSPFNPAFAWDERLAAGPSALFYLGGWTPRHLPDASSWNTDEVPVSKAELPYLPPASYIVQSRNRYQRAAEVLSHSKYSDDTFKHIHPSKSPDLPESEGPKVH